jgi:hypothetical protein
VRRWLEWLEHRAAAIDPVRRLGPDRILTLYHPAYSFTAEAILKEGFADPDSNSWSEKDHPPGVFLTDGEPDGYYSTLIEVQIPESAVLAYEWPNEDDTTRNFYVPAEVVNSRRIRDSGPPQSLNRMPAHANAHWRIAVLAAHKSRENGHLWTNSGQSAWNGPARATATCEVRCRRLRVDHSVSARDT